VPPELERRYLTADLPAIPGEARLEPEDFVVEEVPLYEPSGEGEHLYLRIQKRGVTTDEVVRRLAQRLRVKRNAIGYAGKKDAKAITTQLFSAHRAKAPGDLADLGDSQLTVLEAKPHRNKLKVGHLKGNRFRLRLAGAGEAEEAARATLTALAERGVPNAFGLQRFGRARTTHRLGQALVQEDGDAFVELLLQGARVSQGEAPLPTYPGPLADAREAALGGDYAAAQELFPRSMQPERALCRALAQGRRGEDAVRGVPRKQRIFYVSAFQSLLFNAYLWRRLDRIDRLEEGEVATLHRNGAAFVVTDLGADQPRCAAREISPSGPLFGRRVLRPVEGSSARADEEAVLAEFAPGLGAELTEAWGAKPLGQRRSLRIPMADVEVARDGDDLRVAFFLPKGCYATSVLEELFKRPTD
jgi:tRNA pseudouridine13 synthase